MLRFRGLFRGIYLKSSRPHQFLPCRSVKGLDSVPPPGTPAITPASGQWEDLDTWRASGIDLRRGWLRRRPTHRVPAPGASIGISDSDVPNTMAAAAALILNTADPLTKCELAHHAFRRFVGGGMPLGVAEAPGRPARPERPQLVRPKEVPPPQESPLPANIYVLHNLAHIELNAVDLAMDTLVRFSDFPLDPQFFIDFARIADEEARHFGWVVLRMRELGFDYGDMVAHDILWQGAELSSQDLCGRIAVVNLTQESRGLDAGPRSALRLQGLGDLVSASIVDRITFEERAHVAVGVFWFREICKKLGLDPQGEFRFWAAAQGSEILRPPFNDHARTLVGMERSWYDPTMWEESDRVALRQSGSWDSRILAANRAALPAQHETGAGATPGQASTSSSLVDAPRRRGIAGATGSETNSKAAASTSSSPSGPGPGPMPPTATHAGAAEAAGRTWGCTAPVPPLQKVDRDWSVLRRRLAEMVLREEEMAGHGTGPNTGAGIAG